MFSRFQSVLNGSLLLLLFSISSDLHAQQSYVISGRIIDSLDNSNLAGVSIRIKGTSSGIVTNDNGAFELKISKKLPVNQYIGGPVIGSFYYVTFVFDNNKLYK